MKEKEILDNLGLVYKAMKDLHCKSDTQDTLEDLFQIGVIGLIKGVNDYKEERNTQKSTFYVTCIKSQLKRYFQHKTRKARNEGTPDLSLNYEIQNDEKCELLDLIPSDYNLEDEIIIKEKIEQLNKALNKLKSRKYKVFIFEYFGINNSPLSFTEIAKKYGVSRQCVQQSIKRGLNHLRKEYKNEKIYFED